MPSTTPLWTVLAEFPLFVLRVFAYPRGVVRGQDWERAETLQRLGLYAVIWLTLLVLAFGNNHKLSEAHLPRVSTFKGIVMRGHDRSWDGSEPGWSWLQLAPVYSAFGEDKGAAKRLWDSILTYGFLAFTFFAGLIATAVLARLRMWRFGLTWDYAIGTGILAYLAAASCLALSLVPLALLLVCRHCWVRLGLYVLLNVVAWAYYGYYTLSDLGERPRGGLAAFGKSVAWGFAQGLLAYVVFLLLIICVLPLI